MAGVSIGIEIQVLDCIIRFFLMVVQCLSLGCFSVTIRFQIWLVSALVSKFEALDSIKPIQEKVVSKASVADMCVVSKK